MDTNASLRHEVKCSTFTHSELWECSTTGQKFKCFINSWIFQITSVEIITLSVIRRFRMTFSIIVFPPESSLCFWKSPYNYVLLFYHNFLLPWKAAVSGNPWYQYFTLNEEIMISRIQLIKNNQKFSLRTVGRFQFQIGLCTGVNFTELR